ncbi:unnamed protein product [Rhodiola kirilowii]
MPCLGVWRICIVITLVVVGLTVVWLNVAVSAMEREKRQRKKVKKKTEGPKEQGNEKELMAVCDTQAELTKETKLTENHHKST